MYLMKMERVFADLSRHRIGCLLWFLVLYSRFLRNIPECIYGMPSEADHKCEFEFAKNGNPCSGLAPSAVGLS